MTFGGVLQSVTLWEWEHQCTRGSPFLLQPKSPKQRQYEALRAFFIERQRSKDVAPRFGYSVSAFHVLCHHFRRDAVAAFLSPETWLHSQPKKSVARELIISLRKRNYSVYEISRHLKESGRPLSPTAVGKS